MIHNLTFILVLILSTAGCNEPNNNQVTNYDMEQIDAAFVMADLRSLVVAQGENIIQEAYLNGTSDAAIAKLQRFIDQAVLANLRELEIIHGMGTGILQKLVHEALDGHPQVASFSFANFDVGGTGATIVTIR
ncbi:Smr/MutS family protein [Candidatus Neomarinimicrobiota bacterium]